MISYQSILAMLASKSFQGCMITVDMLPTVLIPFTFAPETINDDWSAEYEYHTSPGSRYQYPIFKGCSPRVVEFVLRFDQNYPISFPGAGKDIVYRKIGVGGSASPILLAMEIENVIAGLELLKLPKQGVSNVIKTQAGFTRVSPGISDPCPPLVCMAENAFKIYLGYLSEARINVTRRNYLMQPTRIEVGCKFLTTPDLIFSTVEDIKRLLYAAKGFYTFYDV